MNFAFSALLIFLLILPGIIFRYSYRKGSWNSPVVFSTLPEDITQGIIWSIPIHCIWIHLSQYPFQQKINLKALFIFLTGQNFFVSKKPDTDYLYQAVKNSIESIDRHPEYILLYFFSIYISAWGLGYLSHEVVRFMRLDIQFKYLRFNNEWYYLFSGQQRAIDRNDKDKDNDNNQYKKLSKGEIKIIVDEIDFVQISVLMVVDKEIYEYKGVLNNYFFNDKGELDRLILGTVTIINERTQNIIKKEKGHVIIKYADIQTINIKYCNIDQNTYKINILN